LSTCRGRFILNDNFDRPHVRYAEGPNFSRNRVISTRKHSVYSVSVYVRGCGQSQSKRAERGPLCVSCLVHIRAGTLRFLPRDVLDQSYGLSRKQPMKIPSRLRFSFSSNMEINRTLKYSEDGIVTIGIEGFSPRRIRTVTLLII